MQNTTQTGKPSELSYQGPLIGMRSTRTQSGQTETKPAPKKQ